MKKYTFRECTLSKLDTLFRLRQTCKSPTLDSWLQTPLALLDREKIVLESYQKLLLVNSNAWNEQEFYLHFIGPVFGLVHFTESYRFNLFAERSIGATVPSLEGDIKLSGEPDGLIATGYWKPKIPMFAFSKYKRTLDPSGDPAGQVLAAMLVGQALNQQPIPIYGSYVIGSYWHFLVLEGKEYTMSQDFSATTDDIFEIFRILKALRIIQKINHPK